VIWELVTQIYSISKERNTAKCFDLDVKLATSQLLDATADERR
jgi:hypothetical protein